MDDVKRTLFDAVQENFKVAGRKHYLHRIIYIGEHKYNEPPSAFKEFMGNKIKTLHEGYCDEVLTGFLLAYPTHFVHLVESSEDTLMRHILSICEDDAMLARIKVLLVTYHINQRYYHKWGYSICHPPVLFERLDPECSLEETARQSKICLSKIYRLTKTLIQQSATGLLSVTEHLSDRFPALLPECALLDFLLGSRTLRDFREYASFYRTVPDLFSYDDTVWPIACEYVPTNVLDSLPKHRPRLGMPSEEEEEEDDLLGSVVGDVDESEANTEDKEHPNPANEEKPVETQNDDKNEGF